MLRRLSKEEFIERMRADAEARKDAGDCAPIGEAFDPTDKKARFELSDYISRRRWEIYHRIGRPRKRRK